MTQPFLYDEHSYDGSTSFQYPDNFQPCDGGYNVYQAIESAWPATNEHMTSTNPPFYEELPLPIQQAPPQLGSSQDLTIEPYGPWNGYPTAFEVPQILPYHTRPPFYQIQPVECLLASHTDIVPGLLPRRPVIALEWRDNDSITASKRESEPPKKRKAVSLAPAFEGSHKDANAAIRSHPRQVSSSRSLEDCMGLFDTTLTATKEKRRRKVFSAQERKVVQSVRTVGACIQCKFRKKTCSAGNPCPYCARLAGRTTLGTQLCQRESPFIGRSMMKYYPTSSRRRILDFCLSTTKLGGTPRIMYIDGTGPANHPLCIKVLALNSKNLESSDRAQVLRTVIPEHKMRGDQASLAEVINVIKPGSLSAFDLETWAVDYTTKYSATKLPHATGFKFGIEYAKKGLPYSDIVNKITRLVSFNFVLRAGVTILSGSLPGTKGAISPFRTIQAQIDTLLFESFKTTEKSLFRDLQRLIFRSAGSLARDAVVPVCFRVWQLARLQCMLASQLTNLAAHDLKRSRRADAPLSAPSSSTSIASEQATLHPANSRRARQSEAENLTHGLNLLLCTFEALFRNACPILLDWNDPFNKDLLNNDEELLALACKMGRTLRGYRAKGHSRKFKAGFGYDKEMSGRIRGLLRER